MELNLAEENLLIQVDFNFCTSLKIGMKLNSNQSVKVLLEKIWELNDSKYQELLMLDLPVYLSQPKIERFYDFLERDADEQAVIEQRLRES